jgi:hypothetical protein
MIIEIAERIAKSNKAYYANAKQIKSKFLHKNTKMKVYKTVIIPVVTYLLETWTLTSKDEKSYTFLKGKYKESYLFLSILTIFGEYEKTWRLIN